MARNSFTVRVEEVIIRKWPHWVVRFWTKACRYPLVLGVLLKIFKEVK